MPKQILSPGMRFRHPERRSQHAGSHACEQERKSLKDAPWAGQLAKAELIRQAARQHAAHCENLACRQEDPLVNQLDTPSWLLIRVSQRPRGNVLG